MINLSFDIFYWNIHLLHFACDNLINFNMDYFLFLLAFSVLENVNSESTCKLSKEKIPVHIRGMMTRTSVSLSKEAGSVMEAAVNHINNMEGILDDYHICFQWNHTQVCK